jgi:spore germination cell wall hydrolase CwlJ-like protein
MIKKLTTMIAICATITSSSLALTFHEGKDWGVDFDVEDTHCLALNIYYEARNDNLAGKVAVSDVVFNRMLDARYPSTICDVVQQAKLSQWH